jgi:hypothetical protein
MPTQWTRVLERNPEAMDPDPEPGYVSLDMPGKIRYVAAAWLEFREDLP